MMMKSLATQVAPTTIAAGGSQGTDETAALSDLTSAPAHETVAASGVEEPSA
jgi:hypothetical protein